MNLRISPRIYLIFALTGAPVFNPTLVASRASKCTQYSGPQSCKILRRDEKTIKIDMDLCEFNEAKLELMRFFGQNSIPTTFDEPTNVDAFFTEMHHHYESLVINMQPKQISWYNNMVALVRNNHLTKPEDLYLGFARIIQECFDDELCARFAEHGIKSFEYDDEEMRLSFEEIARTLIEKCTQSEEKA